MATVQQTFEETLYVHMCVECSQVYWFSTPPRKGHHVFCEVCGHDCVCVDTITYSPWDLSTLDEYAADPETPSEPEDPWEREQQIAEKAGVDW